MVLFPALSMRGTPARLSWLTLEKCFLASDSRDGGGFWIVISSTCPGAFYHISAIFTSGCMQAAQAQLQGNLAERPLAVQTFMGGKRAKGACPCASSRMVMPKDQMSARELYLGGA